MNPEFSIVVPVYHEEEEIADFVHFVESLNESAKAELVVVDGAGGSTLSQIPETPLEVSELVTRAGRGYQISAGCQAAAGETILVVHVDTRIPTDSLVAVRSALLHYPAGAFDLSIPSNNPIVRTIGIVGRIRSRFSRVPYGDQAHFFRRTVLDRIGGYPEIPLMEDVAFMDELKRRDIPITILRRKARTSDRRWTKEGAVFTTARNWTILTAYRLGASPESLLRWYRTHR